ncbi:hypothetical protein H5410_040141 [Solanum commersonii]|uniref:Uncharacterized protein n=1 Tax=Solanum commersonii TaxID=4109 RepID=A0A9J5XN15_SOLCO|nr:hypothetical protein H5410_040141 [Solanum commersonii]
MYHLHNERWYRQNQLLRSALIASLSTEVVFLVNTAETSYDVWNTLCSMYAKPSRARILSLKDSLTRATKGTQSMSAYLQHIKQLVTTFNSTGATITFDDVTLYVLNGLPSEYKGISDSIQTRDTSLNFDELYEKLCDYEQQLQRDPTPPTFPLTANFAAKTNSFNSRNKKSNTGSNKDTTQQGNHHSNGKQDNRPICQYCDKPSHVVKQCRKLQVASPWLNLFSSNTVASGLHH